ncbi:mRNA metabolism modulator [Aeromonas phage GomatiRiver_11]|nr:hypothetical protein OBDJBBDK_00067 [Aeromonas phage AhFM11]WKW84240.1 mRNA metabolism modulator [Aeromonas phage GomatiRiver_11]
MFVKFKSKEAAEIVAASNKKFDILVNVIGEDWWQAVGTPDNIVINVAGLTFIIRDELLEHFEIKGKQVKAKFKSPQARLDFIEYGEKHWGRGVMAGMSNNNRKIARVIGMNAVDVVPCLSPFVGWYDIYIDDKHFESISAREVGYFEFIEG